MGSAGNHLAVIPALCRDPPCSLTMAKKLIGHHARPGGSRDEPGM